MATPTTPVVFRNFSLVPMHDETPVADPEGFCGGLFLSSTHALSMASQETNEKQMLRHYNYAGVVGEVDWKRMRCTW